MPGLSFITLLAYDYYYAFDTISSYYDIADEIILGVDADRLTWMGQPFFFDLDAVRAFIQQIDAAGKIRIVEGNFHAGDDPSRNETDERCELSRLCAAGNWIVQIDCDEVLLNPAEFKQWLLANDPNSAVAAQLLTVFKRFGNQLLIVTPADEGVPVATRIPGQYTGSRWSEEKHVNSPLQLLHFSWGRTADELRQKLNNWGHALQVDREGFYQLWESVTLENYQQVHNFHPIESKRWKSLTVATIQRSQSG